MIAEVAKVSWPAPITSIKDLRAALRNGFDMVRLPLAAGSAPSAAPAYRLRRDGQDSPSNILSGGIAYKAITLGMVGHPMKLHDGAELYKLTTKA